MKVVAQDFEKARRQTTLRIRDEAIKWLQDKSGYVFVGHHNDLYKTKQGEVRRIKGNFEKLIVSKRKSKFHIRYPIHKDVYTKWNDELQQQSFSERYKVELLRVGKYCRAGRNWDRTDRIISYHNEYNSEQTITTFILKISKR